MGPVTQEPIPERIVIKVPKRAPAPAAPPPEPEKPKGRDLSAMQFVENTLDDFGNTVKDIFGAVVHTLKLGGDALVEPTQYLKDLKKVFTTKSGKEAMKQFAGGLVPFKEVAEKGAGVLYDKPVSTGLLEVLNVLPVVGAMTRGSGMLAKSAGAVAKGEALIKAGTWMETIATKVATSAFDKTVKTVSRGYFDPAKSRVAKQLLGEVNAYALEKTGKDIETLGKSIGSLSDDEAKLFHDIGAKGLLPTEMAGTVATTEKGLAALEDWRAYATASADYFKGKKLLDDPTIRGALVKKMALETDGVVNAASKVRAEERLALLEATPGAILPVWRPHVWERTTKGIQIENVLDDLASGGNVTREGVVGSLEEMKGATGYITDPRKYIPRAIADFRKTEGKLTFADRLLERPDLIKGDGLEGFKSKGVPEGINRKYYEDPVRAKEISQITDPTIQRLLKSNYETNSHAALQLYDRVMNAFSKQATLPNPKFYVGQFVGDAVLGALAGSDWLEGVKLRKAGALPSQISADVGIVRNVERTWDANKGLGTRLLEKGADIAQIPDKLTRAGIFAKHVMPRLRKLGYSFEAGAERMKQMLRVTENVSDLEVDLRRVREHIARTDPQALKVDRILRKLEAKEAALVAQVERAELKTRVASTTKQERLAAEAASARTKAEAILEAKKVQAYSKGVKDKFPEMGDSKAARRADALSKEGEAARQAGVWGSVGQKGADKALDDLQTLRQRIVALEARRDAHVGDILSNKLKIAEYEGRLGELQDVLSVVRDGISRQNMFVGDYLGLSGFEQKVMRRIIPFYAWNKAMAMLAFRLPFLAPVKTFMWHRYAQALNTLKEDPDLKERLNGYLPVGVLKDGKTVWLRMNALGPFGSLKTQRAGDIPIPNIMNPLNNPFISLGFRMLGGKTVWDMNRVPYGEPMTTLSNGAHVRFRADGKLEEVIPQEPLVSGMTSLFPIIQQIRGYLTPYTGSKRDWKGAVVPEFNSDGSYKYPKEALEQFGGLLGMPFDVGTVEEMRKRQNAKVQSAIRNLGPAYKRGTAEEQEIIRSYMHDLQNEGKYREMKGR